MPRRATRYAVICADAFVMLSPPPKRFAVAPAAMPSIFRSYIRLIFRYFAAQFFARVTPFDRRLLLMLYYDKRCLLTILRHRAADAIFCYICVARPPAYAAMRIKSVAARLRHVRLMFIFADGAVAAADYADDDAVDV